MRGVLKSLCFVFGMTLLGGCISLGVRIDPLNIGLIEEGVTTKQEIEALFGKPVDTDHSEDGKSLYLYDTIKFSVEPKRLIPLFGSRLGSYGMNYQGLFILFSKEDVVLKHKFFTNSLDLKEKYSAVSLGEEITRENFEKIIPEKTTKAELLEILGPPMKEGLDVSGFDYLTWFYTYDGAFGKTKDQELHVYMDKNDIVYDVIFEGEF